MSLIPTPPIHSLPDDLLREIFAIIHNEQGVNVFYRFGGFWILLQVCKRWRRVAQDTATLWTDITIFEGISLTYTPPAVLERTRLCLKFSKELPLDVTLIIPPESDIDATLYNTVSALIQDVSRWKTLCLNYASFSLMAGRSDTHSVSRPLIQPGELKGLQTFIYDGDDRDIRDCKMFLGADALEIVELRGWFLTTALEFPWANLKRLEVRECAVTGEPGTLQGFDIGKIFESLSSLEELAWESNIEVFNPVLSVIRFPHLRYITINDSSEIAEIMPMLRFPSLIALKVTSYNCFRYEEISSRLNIAQILSMLKDSNPKCGIKFLKLTLDDMDTEDFLQLLRFAQHIEELTLGRLSKEQTTEILDNLRWQSPTTSLLPCLQGLYFEAPWTAGSKEAFDRYVSCMIHIICSRGRPANVFLPDDQHGRWPKGKLCHIRSRISVRPDMLNYYHAGMRKLEDVGILYSVKVAFGVQDRGFYRVLGAA